VNINSWLFRFGSLVQGSLAMKNISKLKSHLIKSALLFWAAARHSRINLKT
jgi:hypothetical protein